MIHRSSLVLLAFKSYIGDKFTINLVTILYNSNMLLTAIIRVAERSYVSNTNPQGNKHDLSSKKYVYHRSFCGAVRLFTDGRTG